jgi:hypothetical protein
MVRPGMLRRFLYSKWFYASLVIVSLLDITADVSEQIWGWSGINIIAIAVDLILDGLSIWIFTDLHRRRPKNGRRSGR